ncbi:MAG: General secretion pathway protein D [uncultured Campylobacterales bacterium]|uniref:General secretion pathway protein D n=1 Tax=uncultured Campylobacterales bacterium TaxID=352960 RepID=A0A6S6SJS0_9BACT|nr:MAG: General secretion pathway protein D [uncultured Campylobacterales bacterium]
MKLNKLLVMIMFLTSLLLSQKVDINFKDLEVEQFIKIVAKITNKNILIDGILKGKVNFVSNKSIEKNQLIELLHSVLETKKYTLVDTGEGFLKVVKKNTALAENLPIVRDSTISQMKTDVIKINDIDAKFVAGQFKHLLSSYAKIVIMQDTNSIVISDFPKNIKTVRKIINEITDKSKKIVEFVPLQYTKASKMLVDVRLIAKSLFPLKSAVHNVVLMKNDTTNSIIIIGTRTNIDKLYPYIERLDAKQDEMTKELVEDIEESTAEQSVFVLHLNNAEASSVATTVNAIVKKQKRPVNDPEPFVSADKNLNALVVVSSGIEYQKIKRVVSMLDVERQQVYVKAKIIEISTDRASQMGISLMDDSLNIIGSRNEGIVYSPTVLGLASSINYEISDILKTLTLGATLSFLKENGVANILSEPSILCINNESSSIYVGQVEPILTSSTDTTTSTSGNRTYSREDIGLSLEVTPRVSQDNKVILEVHTKLEDVLAVNSDGQVTTSKREVKTTAIVKDGASVIVGGLIRDKKSDSTKKIPLLGDIPIVGKLFTYESSSKDMTNLVIILTPYIVNRSGGLSKLKEKLSTLNELQLVYNKAVGKDLEKNLKRDVVDSIAEQLSNDVETTYSTSVNDSGESLVDRKNEDEFMNMIDKSNVQKSDIKVKKSNLNQDSKKVYILSEGNIKEPKNSKIVIEKPVEKDEYFVTDEEISEPTNTNEFDDIISELQDIVVKIDAKAKVQKTKKIDIDIEDHLDSKITDFVNINR